MPACLGMPLRLPIRVEDDDIGDSTRVYVWDPGVCSRAHSIALAHRSELSMPTITDLHQLVCRLLHSDVDKDLYASKTAGDLMYLPDGGDYNMEFFSKSSVALPSKVKKNSKNSIMFVRKECCDVVVYPWRH